MHVIHHLHVHALFFIIHHCIRVEIETPELKEGEPKQEPVIHKASLENQAGI
jgi:hypothetical protein